MVSLVDIKWTIGEKMWTSFYSVADASRRVSNVFLWRSWLRELQPSRRRQCNIWFLREPTLYRIGVGMYVRGLYGHVYVKGCDSNFEVYFFKLQKLLHFLSRSALSFGIIYWRNDYVYFKCSCVLTWIHNLTEKIEGLLCYTRVKQGWTHQNDVS